ncbi:MAG: response regulator [Pyrinomonadaceae bacterium]
MDKILIIDDDEELCELVSEYLTVEGFDIECVNDGASGLDAALSGDYDMAILDVMLPKMNGFDVLRNLREKSKLPVIMLTARGDDMERIVGLEIGADDYLPKPFNPRELAARLRAILRRTVVEEGDPEATEKLDIDGIQISPASRIATCDGRELNLTSVEFELLHELLKEAGKIVKKEDLSENVLERKLSPYDRSLDMHISNLRKKLGERADGTERHQNDPIGRLYLHVGMKLFLKIFLWFLAAVGLMVGVLMFVTKTFQTEPMVNRFERNTRNNLTVYSGTATQIANAEGEAGLRLFLERLKGLDPSRQLSLVSGDGKVWFGDPIESPGIAELSSRTIASGQVETDFSAEERTLGAAPVNFPDGRRLLLVFQWERQAPPSLFWGSTTALVRLGGILLTAIVLCYLLAMYLTSPIRKLRKVTNELADGNLETRVSPLLGRRRDEIGDLARDFDVMAERIEGLITSQQRLNRDISHELRSPLARLNVGLEIAKQRSAPEMKPVFERLENESTRLNDMISRLLTLSKLETGADDVDRVRLDFAELVRDVAADAEFEAQAKGKHVEVSSADSCPVVGSENLLRSAVENVLRNAVRYTPERTVVEVALKRENGHAILKISDHGGGVPEEELPNLFRPFYRVGEARERKTGGTGLGLAIAERAVKAHKGTITARNYNGGLQVEIGIDTVKKGD